MGDLLLHTRGELGHSWWWDMSAKGRRYCGDGAACSWNDEKSVVTAISSLGTYEGLVENEGTDGKNHRYDGRSRSSQHF